MSSLILNQSQTKLSPENLSKTLSEMVNRLEGRVDAAYIFGSASTGEYNLDSDIDLILVKENLSHKFPQRAFEFSDLRDIFPNLDLLVYTQKEFRSQLADSEVGFWKSVRLSLRQIL